MVLESRPKDGDDLNERAKPCDGSYPDWDCDVFREWACPEAVAPQRHGKEDGIDKNE